MDGQRINVEVLSLNGNEKKDELPFEQKLARNKNAVDKARIELRAARPKLGSLEQAELGHRREIKAKEQLKATFGGLVLGYDGPSSPPRSPPGEPRGMIFQPGVNLGPQYPGDLRMTPFCQEKTTRTRLRVRDIWGERPSIKAHFSPVFPADFGSKKGKLPASFFPGGRFPDSEFRGESANSFEKELSMMVFFGKSEELKRYDCPPFFGSSDEVVLEYFDSHNIENLLEHLLALCNVHFPADPFDFMGRYCGHLAESRTDQEQFDKLHRVFYPHHLAALFRLHDKAQRHYLTLKQYRMAMEMMGLIRYNGEPEGGHANAINEETFTREATSALDLMLRSFLV